MTRRKWQRGGERQGRRESPGGNERQGGSGGRINGGGNILCWAWEY